MSFADPNGETDVPWRDPFASLQRTVNLMIWACAVFAVIITIIAFSALFVAWHSLRKQVTTSQENIIALCREMNEHNKELRIIALDSGVPAARLTALLPKPCNSKRLQRIYHT